MKTSLATALAATLLTATSSAIHLIERDGPKAVVGISINRKHVQDPVKRDQLRRRQTQTVSQTLDNEVGSQRYLIHIFCLTYFRKPSTLPM